MFKIKKKLTYLKAFERVKNFIKSCCLSMVFKRLTKHGLNEFKGFFASLARGWNDRQKEKKTTKIILRLLNKKHFLIIPPFQLLSIFLKKCLFWFGINILNYDFYDMRLSFIKITVLNLTPRTFFYHINWNYFSSFFVRLKIAL